MDSYLNLEKIASTSTEDEAQDTLYEEVVTVMKQLKAHKLKPRNR
jgi:hypothetical protein